MNLIAMSGAHGTGKSATIDRIEVQLQKEWQHYQGIAIDHFKVSRRVLAELGMTLEQATANADITKTYQQKVLDAKIKRDSLFKSLQVFSPTPNYTIVDRSIADIYAYTKLWCSKNNVDGNWFINFERDCINAMSMYDIIFLFPTGKFAFVDDGIRAKEDTQATIAKYTEEFIVAYAKNYHVVESVSIDERANEILTTIKKHGSKTSP